MPFDPNAYGPDVAAILAVTHSMPLVASAAPGNKLRGMMQECRDISMLMRSGLWTYHSCFDEAHKIAQDIHNAEGSYWHAILHRREPDAWNSGYWFRQVGVHPVFAELRVEAEALGYTKPGKWDPIAFIDYCEEARENSGSAEAQIACAVTLAEWQLLFDYCARKKS